MKKTVGILFADAMEYAPFVKYALGAGAAEETKRGRRAVRLSMSNEKNTLEIIAVECGVGKVNAAAATAFLIADDRADFILNAGLSGAISKVKREDIVAGESSVECDFDLRAIGYELAVKPDGEKYIHKADERLVRCAKKIDGVVTGRLGTGDIFLADSEKKQQLKEMFGLIAFDMESAAIAAVCGRNGVPVLSVRKISDNADDASRDDYSEMNERAEDCLTQILVKIMKMMLEEEEFWN